MSNILGLDSLNVYHDLIERIGVWIIYTRSDHRFRCRDCWNYWTNDGKMNCDSCFGTGYVTNLERWKVFYTNRVSRNAGIEVPLTRAGFSPENMVYIFSRTDHEPQVQDRIFIVEWDVPRDDIPKKEGRPTRLVQALRVLYVEPFFIGQQIYLLNHMGIIQEDIDVFEPILMRTPITTNIL